MSTEHSEERKMSNIDDIVRSMNALSKEVVKLASSAEHTTNTLKEIKEEIKEIRTLSNDVTILKSERSTLKWVIGLLIPGAMAGGAGAGWIANMFQNTPP